MKCFLFVCLVTFTQLVCFANSYAQEVQISQVEYRSAIDAAYALSERIFPRKATITEREFDGSVVFEETVTIREYLSADRIRVIETSTYKGQKSSIEMVRVGSSFFCREGRRRWKKYNEDCSPKRMTGISSDLDIEFSYIKSSEFLNGERNDVLVHRMRYSFTNEKTKKKTRWLIESRSWLSRDGKLQRQENRTINEDSGATASYLLGIYEYEISDIKIEAPIP